MDGPLLSMEAEWKWGLVLAVKQVENSDRPQPQIGAK
jgi:hypothetical protein